MRWKPQVRFGGRAGETHRARAWQGAPVRPYKKALASIMDKVRRLTRRSMHRTLAGLLRTLNPVLRGWCNYFRHGVCKRTFGYLDSFVFRRILSWLRKRHHRISMRRLIRRHLPNWEIRDEGVELFRPAAIKIERYRYRGYQIPTPWAIQEAAVRAAPLA